MMKVLTDVPSGVVAIEVSGTLRAEDYRDVLLPAIEAGARVGDLRVMIVIPAFDGVTPAALWQDLTMGVEHRSGWQRIALVTDIEWMQHMTQLFGWMTPGEVKQFPLAAREEAATWAAGSS